jgi:hypothetical protein
VIAFATDVGIAREPHARVIERERGAH